MMTKTDGEMGRLGNREKRLSLRTLFIKNGFAILEPRWYDFFWKSPAVPGLEARQR
jgi:hypothetical protein